MRFVRRVRNHRRSFGKGKRFGRRKRFGRKRFGKPKSIYSGIRVGHRM